MHVERLAVGERAVKELRDQPKEQRLAELPAT